MEKNEILMNLEKIIRNGDYNIDQILEIIPEELIGDLKKMVKESAINESKKSKIRKVDKIR